MSTVTGEDIKLARIKFAMHLNYGGGRHGYRHVGVDHPELTVSKTTKNGRVLETHLFVGDVEIPWGEWDAAADALNALRAAPPADGAAA